MSINWKRYTFGAWILASLSLFLYGCSDMGSGSVSTQQIVPVAKKSITGFVSDPSTGLPLSGATIKAYAIVNGAQSSTPLSVPATGTQSDANGAFVLFIPGDYAGTSVVVEATLPASTSKIAATMKQVSAAATSVRTIRTAIALPTGNAPITATISLATEILYQYVQANYAGRGGYSDSNIQTSNLVLENYFGMNFAQTPPLASGATPTTAQLNLTIMIQVFNKLNFNTPSEILRLVTPVTLSDGSTSLGFNDSAQLINDTVKTFVPTGIVIPTGYKPMVVPLHLNPNDTTPPSAPGVPRATLVTINSVALSWTASTTTGNSVAAYLIYRSDISTSVPLATISATPFAASYSYTDTTVTATTTYTYVVKARDAAGNISAGSTSLPITTPATHTISGRVIFNGAGLAGVTINLKGAGTGSTITDASGNYTFTGVQNSISDNDTYSITPLLAGYAFNPAAITKLKVSDANVTGQDFTASFTGSATGGTTYPDGTIIGGITYPTGTVIGGVTYPTATIINGITYPTGTVIGGITFPNGVVIGGVTYPAGTVVGGIAFPVGTVTAGFTYPDGTIIGGVTYPTGVVIGGVIFPTGTVTGGVSFPSGTIIGGITYPSGAVIGGITYPTATIINGVTYPTGSVTGGTTYPNGVVIGGVTYPAGTVVGGIAFPVGAVTAGVTYPAGTIIGGVTYPSGAVIGGVTYPTATIINGVTYPAGTVIGGIAFPVGAITAGVTYPAGTAIGTVTYPSSTVIGGVTYPAGAVFGGVVYPSGSLNGSVIYPAGALATAILFPAP